MNKDEIERASYPPQFRPHEWIDIAYHGSPEWVCRWCNVDKVYGKKGNVYEPCVKREI